MTAPRHGPAPTGRGDVPRERLLRHAPSVSGTYATASPYQHGAPGGQVSGNVVRYVEFVAGVCAAAGEGRAVTLLEVGCGSGSGLTALAQRFRVVATDISLERLRDAGSLTAATGTALAAADVSRLPFRDGAFDAVACHQLLEHLAEPEAALGEMARVLRPGGRLVCVGPNLLSPLYPAGALLGHAADGRWRRPDPAAQRFPFGATAPESAWILLRNLGALAATFLRPSRPLRLFRQPDLRPPAHADSDAVYLATGTDVGAWARRLGLERLRAPTKARHRLGRLSGSYWLAFTKPLCP
jgi:SAM-dependent methyltransferase